MNVEYLPFILPFTASMLAIFIGPIVATRMQKKREETTHKIGHSSMIDNYAGALDSAWNRIAILEKHLERLEKEKNELVVTLTKENRQLKVHIFDLEREIERLSILSRTGSILELKDKEHDNN